MESKFQPIMIFARSFANLKSFVGLLVVSILGIGLGIIAVYFVNFKLILGFPISNDTAVWGQLGDYIGGILNPVLSFFTIIFVIIGLYYQRKEYNEQRALNKIQREESIRQRIDLDKADEWKDINSKLMQNREIFNSIIVNEQRDNNVWVQIKGPEAILSIIRIDLYDKIWNGFKIKLIYRYQLFYDNLTPIAKSLYMGEMGNIQDMNLRAQYLGGENIQQFFECLNPFDFAKDEKLYIKEEIINSAINTLSFIENTEVLNSAMDELFKCRGYIYGHYLRNHYYLLNSIRECKLNEKVTLFKYSRSFLSSSELILLFYNLYSANNSIDYSQLLISNEIFDDLEQIPFWHQHFFISNRESILR